MSLLLTGAASAQSLTDRYFDEYYFPSNPTSATAAGIHKYDDQLEDYSAAGVEKRIAILRMFEAEFAKLAASPDRDLVLSSIRANLLELETVRMWAKNPDLYSSGLSNSAFVIMSRTFAPPEARLKALIARERLMPNVLADARAIAALKDQEEFLTRQAASKYTPDDFKLGAANFVKKLQYEEMVDIPLDRLLEIGYDNLHANQKKFRETAALIDPNRASQAILDDLKKDHPAPDKLLDAFRETCTKLDAFVNEKKIVTIPSPVPPILEETPPFMRALTFASMDTPGPYEAVAKEAFFNVTLPEKDWKPERVEGFMASFNRGTVLSTAIHEAYPGHYVQFLWMQRVDSRARKLIVANSNAEGWAHYTEQMMLDEGYSTDPKMRIGQLQDALLRNARYIVGIEMHTGKRTFEQGIEFFEKEGYQSHEVAEVETKRGASDPTYLYYTLGKLQILKLREDYRLKMGATFSLQEFHDNFMRQGAPPIKIVRRALLGDDSPTL